VRVRVGERGRETPRSARSRGPGAARAAATVGRRRPLPRSVRLRYAAAALGGASVASLGVLALIQTARGPRELPFALITASLVALMAWVLNRQRRAVAALQTREEQLAGQGALLQSTLENMGEGLSVFDREGRLIAWNGRFARILKMPGELATTTIGDILLFQARRGDFGPVEDAAAEARRRVGEFHRDLPCSLERTTASGRVIQIRRRAMPDGGVVSLYSDITERKAAEEKMEAARLQAELANRAKGDFLANMSHELRTPLNAIIGFAEALANGVLGPVPDRKQLEYINDIHASGLLLLSIINDVLDMSKIEAGKLELAQEPVTVQRVVADALRMVSERARSRNLDLVTKLPPGETAIVADERALKQILLNLLSNAIKFSHDGGRVEIRAAPLPDGGLGLEIEDRGIGMVEDEILRALQPFGQAKPATTRSHGGTGLGLPIAKGLAEAHGGSLAVISSPGRGTLVRIALPPSQMPGWVDEPPSEPAAPYPIAQAS
jgi:signal transduction histidine kinase